MKPDSLDQRVETRSSRDWNARRMCDKARGLERVGDYEGARESLAAVWSRIGDRPSIANFPLDTQAEILLRVGALSGWLGSAQQIPGSQEFAKDLLAESIRIFHSIGDLEKAAEAQTDLGICYWREAGLSEARVIFGLALESAYEAANRLRVMINSTTVELSSGNAAHAFKILTEAESLLHQVKDEDLKGRYYLQRALALRRIGGQQVDYLDRALVDYSAASLHFERANHVRYLARVENNIGFILLQLRRYSDAIDHLDRARRIFLQLKDTGSVAQVNETRARVYLAQQRYAEAERTAFSAVTALDHAGEYSLLAEALITHGTTLARRGKHQGARNAFLRAAAVSATAGDLLLSGGAYLTMIEEMHQLISHNQLVQTLLDAESILPAELDADTISRYRHCVRIVGDSVIAQNQALDEQLIGGNLEKELLHLEAHLIERALDEAQGSITRAARSLGLTHQGLAWILDHRHPALAHSRKPRRIRHKSIIKKQ